MLANMLSMSGPSWTPRPYTEGDGLYCAVQPDYGSKLRIMQLCEELGVTTDPSKLHCTIVYSETGTVPSDLIEALRTRPSGYLSSIAYWSGHDNSGFLVARVNSASAHTFHEDLVSAGAQHSHNPYNPHVTLVSDLAMTADLQERIAAVNAQLLEDSIYVNFEEYTISDIQK